jgi:hypothetical protein
VQLVIVSQTLRLEEYFMVLLVLIEEVRAELLEFWF